MGIEAYEATIELTIGSVEAEAPRAGGDPCHRRAYPYPVLTTTGRVATTTFRSFVIENALLKATVIPALGGRIVGLLDKRTGFDVFPPGPLMPETGSPRGAHLRYGVQISHGGEDRANSLGPVECAIQDLPQGVCIACAEIAAPSGLSCHWYFGLSEDRAELLLGARTFNRNLAPRVYDGGATIDLGSRAFAVPGGAAVYDRERDVGLAVWPDDEVFDGLQFGLGRLRWSRYGAAGRLEGRASDAWAVRITPWSGLGGIGAVSPVGAMFASATSVRLQVTREIPGHRLEMVASDGQTMAAPIAGDPAAIVEIDLAGLPVALALVDPEKRPILEWRAGDPCALVDSSRSAPLALVASVSPDDDHKDLRRAAIPMNSRYLAQTALATQCMRRYQWDVAEDAVNAALSYNGEDPIAWWCKAAISRVRGDEEPDPQPMLNAHFLAPMEPLLRAEAFLAQQLVPGTEPSKLLAQLKDRPDECVEVACVLLDMGLLADASRWIDESLRHRDLPMLRYLAAFAFLSGSRMDAEAATQVAAAAKVGVSPPFPWREVEIRALSLLATSFPDDGVLGEFAALSTIAASANREAASL